MKHFKASRRLVEKARNLLFNKGILALPSPKKGKVYIIELKASFQIF